MPNADIAIALIVGVVALCAVAEIDSRWLEPRRRARRVIAAAKADLPLCTHTYAGGRCPRACGRPTETVVR